jgi:hypothetical protein
MRCTAKVFLTAICLGILLDASVWEILRGPQRQPAADTSSATFKDPTSDPLAQDHVPVCVYCDDHNSTCARLHRHNPQLIDICLHTPEDPSCQFGCFDTLLSSTHVDHIEKKNEESTDTVAAASLLWPPLDQGGWFEDVSYCQLQANTSQACLFDTSRWSLLQSPSLQNSRDNVLLLFNSTAGCNLLRERNVSNVRIVGDSLMRHVWQGLVLVLQGKADSDFGKPGCGNGRTFSEVETCRLRDPWGLNVSVCGQEFDNHYSDINVEIIEFTNVFPSVPNRAKTLHIFGVGSHAPNNRQSPNERLGILNATAYKQKSPQMANMNRPYFWGSHDPFIWMPPHYKLSIGRHDETNQRARAFVQETHTMFASMQVPTVNTYTLTEQTSDFFCRNCVRRDANKALNAAKECTYYERKACKQTRETWDGYHYGQTINIHKANLLLHMFARMTG